MTKLVNLAAAFALAMPVLIAAALQITAMLAKSGLAQGAGFMAPG